MTFPENARFSESNKTTSVSSGDFFLRRLLQSFLRLKIYFPKRSSWYSFPEAFANGLIFTFLIQIEGFKWNIYGILFGIWSFIGIWFSILNLQTWCLEWGLAVGRRGDDGGHRRGKNEEGIVWMRRGRKEVFKSRSKRKKIAYWRMMNNLLAQSKIIIPLLRNS